MEIVEKLSTWKCRSSLFGLIAIEGANITDKQLEEIDYLLGRPKLTDLQRIKLDDLILKRDTPPSLSAAAKKELDTIYTEIVSGVFSSITSKYFERGIASEPDALQFAHETIHPNIIPVPHAQQYENEYITGCPDIRDDEHPLTQITDTKCAWSLETLDKAKLSKQYQWQPRCYMYLTGLDTGSIMYVLVDMPDHLIKRECEIHFSQNSRLYISESDAEYIKWCQEYTEKTRYSKYPKHQRFKLFLDKWSPEYETTIINTVTQARQYLLAKHLSNMEEYVANYKLMAQLNPTLYSISDLG